MGVSPWTTALELWKQKCGLADEPEVNDAMRRGTEMEPIARAAYEKETGNIVEPCLAVHPQYDFLRASLDGLDFEGRLAIEIKCPGRKSHNEAREGRVPDIYWPQLQHILMVTGAPRLDYWSFDGNDGVLVPVEPDPTYQAELLEKERAFWDCVVNKIPPEQPKYDGVVELSDPAALTLAGEYSRLTLEADTIKTDLDKAKNKLLALCTGATNKIGGLTISRTKGRLTLDQKALEKSGVDLEPFKQRGDDYWKITLGKVKV